LAAPGLSPSAINDGTGTASPADPGRTGSSPECLSQVHQGVTPPTPNNSEQRERTTATEGSEPQVSEANDQQRPKGAYPMPTDFMSDPLWYKDAVIYELHVRSFFDATNDGYGDFAGMRQKLPYL